LAWIARWNHLDPKTFERQYKDHLSGFHDWDQKEHADEWLVFERNVGEHLSVDETSISNGELYTVLTNKAGKGGKSSLVAIVDGTKAEDISKVFNKIPLSARLCVKEVTLDFSPSMERAVVMSFPKARLVTDRFHVQKLVSEALQEIRVSLRWKAIEEENRATAKARQVGTHFTPQTYTNGDTKKQLLARSRYLLFTPSSKWTDHQQERSVVLFEEFSELKSAYDLTMCFRGIYETSKTRDEAQHRFHDWFQTIEDSSFDSFKTTAQYLQDHLDTILNYFPDRSTNASAESFNAKLKGFRALLRGVSDKKFFLFRVTKLYA